MWLKYHILEVVRGAYNLVTRSKQGNNLLRTLYIQGSNFYMGDILTYVKLKLELKAYNKH